MRRPGRQGGCDVGVGRTEAGEGGRGVWLGELRCAPGGGRAAAGDAHAQCAGAVAHDCLVVSECGGGGWGLVLCAVFVIGYGRAGGVVELWPAGGVCEGGSEDVGVGCVGGAEGYDAAAVRVVDVAEVGETETVHEIAGGA